MDAAQGMKDVIRIAQTAGLSKDVIDLLETKAELLAEQVVTLEQQNATLLSENNGLKLVNNDLKRQIGHNQKSDELDAECKNMLVTLEFSKGGPSCEDLIPFLQISPPKVRRQFDQLSEKGFVKANGYGFEAHVTKEGRDYLDKSGLLEKAPARVLVKQDRTIRMGGNRMF